MTVFVYDASGRTVAEYSNHVDYNGTRYLTRDTLGSTRAVTDKDGALRSRHDYFPFGDELNAGVGGRASSQGYVTDNVRQKFTGYERDDETGLDYAQSRYYGPALGRFTSPDDFLNDTHVSDPQSWNLYAYVRNNPLSLVDPTGQKAKINSTYDEKTNTTTINIRASFAVYKAKGQDVSDEDLKEFAGKIKSGIENALKKQYSIDGRNYVMSANISVQVVGEEAAAIAAGVDNIAEIGNGGLQEIVFGKSLPAQAVSFGVTGESFDRIVFDMGSSSLPPRECSLTSSRHTF